MFGERECHPMSKKANPAALLPILVFLVLYLGLGLIFEYVLKIPMGFYSIPIVVIFLIALLVACCQNRALSFDEKLTLMGHGVGDKNIITMLLIFLAAGMFVGVVGRSSAESVAYFMLSIIPSKFAVAVLFVVSCFVSTAMGTSVGTITLIVPIAIPIAAASGYSLPLCIASVMGGAMFGDNLSFISDTTIAACNGQGCAMKDKFRENFHIAFPAALGMDAVLLTTAGSDPLYRRASRVSMGNVFLIPWTYLPESGDWTQLLRDLGFRTVAMALRNDSVRLDDPRLAAEEKLAIVMGTEGDGLASSTIASCDYTVRIPMYHGVDSLNVAAASAVAFYELGLPPLNEKED